ncbi:hypothetical protein PHMEG_00033387 [Phytophthora megakarya]|uniref:Uncharacterized protein n=1 Tax=Phytophthora megakarya TaxID=4795 RepID=A0A225UTF4_9STRA|nr:hypothetical protein PHMEG_00033387 [Phytophthora megakarya]
MPLSTTSVAGTPPQDQPAEPSVAPSSTDPDSVEITQSSVPSEPSLPAEPSGGTQSTSPIVIQRKPRAKGKPTKKTRSGPCFQAPVPSRRVTTAAPKLTLTIKFPKKVLKWASGFISPPFTLRGSDKCWMRILNARVPTHILAKLQIQCLASEIARFADYTNPQHPWQKTRRKFPPQACLFDTTEFDQESSLSQRAPPDLRYRGYWRNFRGAGHKKDPEFGFSQWERDHWIPPRAVELFLTMAYEALRLNTHNLDRLEILEIKAMLDAVDQAWRDYNIDRVKRNDRLRTKYPNICWKWSLESPPPVDGMIPEFLFEPTMPLYGMEYLTWIPKTPMWLKEVAELDARESTASSSTFLLMQNGPCH